jgi:response regulator RpfG family c-di-GMP phosphodiesterase
MVAEVMNARVVSLLCPGAEGDLVFRAALGVDEQVVQGASVPMGAGVAGWVAQNRRPVCVTAAGEDSDVKGSGRAQYRSGTFLSVPLEGERGLLGVLNVTDPASETPFTAEDCHLLLHLAERVTGAWERSLAVEQSQAGVDDTAQALRDVLKHLERGRRSAPDRVRLARGVARQLKLPESEVGVISFAASVHDLGMATVDEQVRHGAGGLDEDDREAVERHPEAGADMLRPLETMGAVREIVLSHHEWWDGSGYPRGLAGIAIPVGGRILAVVDAWESMTVGRAHKPARTPEEAMEELRRLGGRQFDPGVVEAFERALAEDRAREGDNPSPAPERAAADAGR